MTEQKIELPLPKNSTEAYLAMKEIRDDQRRLILEAPLSLEDRKNLALMTAAEFMGVAACLFVACQPELKGQPFSVIFTKISELLIAQYQKDEAQARGQIA